MKNSSLFSMSRVAAAAALVVSSGTYAAGMESFDLTFSGSGESGSIDMTGVSIGNGEFDVTSATGTINGLAASLYDGAACTASTCQALTFNGNTIFTTLPNAFNVEVNYDDVLYTGSSTALNGGLFADTYGLAFVTSAGVGANVYGLGTYQYADSTGPSLNGSPISANLVVAAVPEPSTYLMMLLGLAGIGFAVKRKTRASSHSAAAMPA